MDEVDKYIKRIGDNIVRLRKKKKLKQIDLSVKLNIEDSALRRIESGRTNPTIKTLYSIAKELDVELIELLK